MNWEELGKKWEGKAPDGSGLTLAKLLRLRKLLDDANAQWEQEQQRAKDAEGYEFLPPADWR